jgi:hypothetical protein
MSTNKGESMEGKIQILKVEDDSGEPSACWRTDEKDRAASFFDYLSSYDYDPDVKVVVEWITEAEWKTIEENGEKLA